MTRRTRVAGSGLPPGRLEAMKRSLPVAAASTALLVLVAGCTAPASSVPVASSAPAAPTTASPTTPSAAPAASTTSATPTPAVVQGLTARIAAPPVVTEAVEGRVFAVDGVLLVNKQHPLARDHVPAWASEPNGLHPQVSASLDHLIADAKAQGTKILLRSGYRSYSAQAAIFSREMKRQPAATVRLYFAEAGKSEHQTGLAVDVWDGRQRGYSFSRTPQAKWLAEHAWEYGFIIRYPEGRTDVTGYAYESWHLRYVGTEISAQFGPASRLTLEEFLGVATTAAGGTP